MEKKIIDGIAVEGIDVEAEEKAIEEAMKEVKE